ncbi:class I SAM-dependent methyltransferase [Gemmatimonas aurantiaca]|nr:class I SAM-dependent methyltransferase [Gemmatimonas aurantiaca]
MSERESSNTEQLQNYYNLRANEYESVYDFVEPLRRQELQKVERLIASQFVGRTVLEVACGAGYWTQRLAEVAKSVHAIDGSQEMLNVAQAKHYKHPVVTFDKFNAYALASRDEMYDAALAGFWLSHVPQENMESFLKGFHQRLKPNATVLFFDNNLVEGMGGSLVTMTDSPDTFKKRRLANGAEHIIIKNYFTAERLHELFSPYAQSAKTTLAITAITMDSWYWSVLYQTR